jgi:drug/metabolite transporter (DMT)-like permease
VIVMVVALLEATACLAFGVVVLIERGQGATSGSSGALAVGVTALIGGACLVAVGVVLGRGGRRTAGAFVVVQVLVALIGLSQAASGLAAGRWGFSLVWAAAAAAAGVGLWALLRALRDPARGPAAGGPGPG